MKGLDEKDLLLLHALQKNSRASLVALSRDVGLSRSATHDRITKLEEQGVIKGYTIRVDRTALPLVRAFLTVQFSAGNAQSALAPVIQNVTGVEAAYCLSGDIDMLVYCECETVEQLSELRDELALFDGVVDISTRNVLASSQS